ncbi:MAG: iron-containing alcohol dehydrogenase, partial [Clostridia bacterium]|nr:iron-containing alcohol dehydrogenase [Clostridia bacterium]
MNIAKKAFCRVFQFGFRIALPVLPFRDPKILRRVEEVPELLKRIDHKHPLLVTDKMIRSLGLTKPLENAMTAAGIPFSVYDETDQNPTSNMVSAALDIYKKDSCDCLIAAGGGAAMDR